MISFKKFLLLEGKVEILPNGFRDAKIYVNPSRAQMQTLEKEAHPERQEFRGIKHGNKHYVWDADLCVHNTVAKHFGLRHTEETPLEGSMFTGKQMGRYDYDVKRVHQMTHCKVDFSQKDTGYVNTSKRQWGWTFEGLNEVLSPETIFRYLLILINSNFAPCMMEKKNICIGF